MNNITIEFCPEDRARIDRLIAAMENKACERCVENALEAMSIAHETAQAVPAAQPIPVQPATPIPTMPPAAPVAPMHSPTVPTAQPVQPVVPAAPVAPSGHAIPTANVTYDMDTIARAGSALIDQNPANIGKLMELLAKYGTNAITTLPKEHYGAFVTDLRALGASI